VKKMHRLLDEIGRAETIAVLSHVPPDGDALGSMLAFVEALAVLGKPQARAFSAEVPGTYSFMPGIDRLESEREGDDFDLAIIVDCADARLTGAFLPLYRGAKRTASLDHHMCNAGNGDLSFIDTTASSAAQVVLAFIAAARVELTKSMATNLYVGVSTDTGNFCFSNTNGRTFRDAAVLIEAGADHQTAVTQLYKRRSLIKTRLIGRAIQNLELLEGGRVALMVIDDPDFEALGTSELDFEGVVDYGRDIEGVEVAALIRKIREGRYRVSLRSKFSADVNAVAQRLGGGGHERASGCSVGGTLQEARERLLFEIDKELRP